MQKIRTFVALEFPGAVRSALEEARDQLRFLNRQVRWVKPDGAHLTLKFLGNVSEGQIPDIVSAVQQAVLGNPVLQLSVSELGGFPSLAQARVLWLGIQGDLEALQGLQQHVCRALEEVGFPPEKRRFLPHITLGRVRGSPVRLPGVGVIHGAQFQLDRVTVIKSDLGPGGAVYSALGYGMLGV